MLHEFITGNREDNYPALSGEDFGAIDAIRRLRRGCSDLPPVAAFCKAGARNPSEIGVIPDLRSVS